MKRALRRHHYQRLKSLRKKKLEFEGWKISDNVAGSYATTACKCSCWMCGNPRRKQKMITQQEYLSSLKYIEGCFESDIHCSMNVKNKYR